jgi:hypothetical protein
MNRSNNLLSAIKTIASPVLNKFIKKEDEKNIIGQIDGSFFAYITPLMIFIAIVVTAIVGSAIDTIAVYYLTGVELNSLILFLGVFTIFKVFYNSFNLYRTAQFMKKIEKTIEKNVITEKEVLSLQTQLEREITLLNTKQMQDCIANLSRFGHMNFTDKDAMLIKSKLGYRIGIKRSDCAFNAGILVMLGLLGTFLGLLSTVDAVGSALNSMSSIGGGGEEITMETMSSFIGSLAAPLQGMGLAFSSSLFGLIGSLLIGFFGNLSGGAENNFIENTSRWIDNRIPKFNPEKSKNDPSNKTADQDDLKHWLAGYVHLSVKTNKQLAHLSQTILSSIEQGEGTRNALTSLVSVQESLTHNLDTTTQNLQNLSQKGDALINAIGQSHGILSDIKNTLATGNHSITSKLESLPAAINNSLDKTLSSTLSATMTSSLNTAVTNPLATLDHNIQNLGRTLAEGQNNLIAQLQDQSTLHHIGNHIDEARNQIHAAGQVQNAKMDTQNAILTRLETTLQNTLSGQYKKPEIIEGQLNSIHDTLRALNAAIETQNKLIANMPTPSVIMPSYTRPTTTLSANPHQTTTITPSSTTNAQQLKQDAQSMLDDIEKDESTFFKNFFGIKPDEKE